MSDCIAVVSGGLDSVTMLHYLVKALNLNPAVISFTYGQKHTKELEFATYHVNQLDISDHLIIDLTAFSSIFASSALVVEDINLPDIDSVQGDSQPPTYVPNRNMLFLAIAVARAETLGVTDVYYGAQKQDMYGYWDTTPEFLDKLNAIYALNRRNKITIQAPFIDYSKSDILKIGLEMDVEYHKTWSCYAGNEKACGTCPTCAERLAAFKQLGLSDPLPYE